MAVVTLASPAGAQSLYAAFDDKPIDQPIGTRGASFGEPVGVDPWLTAIVRSGPMGTPSLELQDQDDYMAGAVRFEFEGSVEVASGVFSIAANLWFDAYEDFNLYIREQGSAAASFLSMHFLSGGGVVANDEDSSLGMIGSYEVRRVFPITIVFDMNADTYDVYFDCLRVVHDEPHGVTDRGVGAVLFGTTHDPDFDGRLYLDDLYVAQGDLMYSFADCNDNEMNDACEIEQGLVRDRNDNGIPDGCELSAAASPHPGRLAPRLGVEGAVASSLSAFPNPFSTKTMISFAGATEDGDVRLYAADGRWVRTLSVRPGATSGTVQWDGRDATGRAVPSGIYYARMERKESTATTRLMVLR
jgi:hypothetical protein